MQLLVTVFLYKIKKIQKSGVGWGGGLTYHAVRVKERERDLYIFTET